MFNQYSRSTIIETINNLGAKANPTYKAVEDKCHKANSVTIICTDPNHINYQQTKIYKLCNLKHHNPFSINGEHNRKSDNSVINLINELGQKVSSKYSCVNPYVGKKASGLRLVSVKCNDVKNIYFNQTKVVYLCNLKRGSDPFNNKQQNIEHDHVHPQIEKLLKSFNCIYQKEVSIGKGSRIDFTFKLNNRLYYIEAKRSDKFYTKNNQLSRYKALARLNNAQLFLVDIEGRHFQRGFISLAQFEKILSQL